MDDNAFHRIEQALRSEGCDQGFDLLAETFRESKDYPRLFETRLMKARRAPPHLWAQWLRGNL